MILLSDTIIHSRAMMIHFQNTPITNRAMMSPLWLYMIADKTDTGFDVKKFFFLETVLRVDKFVLLRVGLVYFKC